MTLVSWIAIAILLFTSVGLLLSRDWRWGLGLLAAQYLAMFYLVTLHWPFGMASVKLVTGWMVSASLGVTRLGISEQTPVETAWPQGRLFRVFAALIVIVLVFASAPLAGALIPGVSLPVIVGGLALMGMGLLHLGLTADIFRITLGLLTVLAGFETLYATVETSILLAGLLSIVNLGLALAGAYLMTASPEEEKDEGFVE